MNVLLLPPIFQGPAVWWRCCPPPAEGVACCQSPHKLRGAAAVLSFFSARPEEVARCQCLRGWAQAVGRVTPSWDGGPPWCSWGMWQEGQPLCRGGKGARHTHNLSSPSRRIADTVPQEYSRREDAAQQGGVCEGYPRHASGRRGRRSLHPYTRLVWKSWHEPAGAAIIPT